MTDPTDKGHDGDSPADSRSLHAAYATGLLSMGQSELLTVVIPLWAVLQGASAARSES